MKILEALDRLAKSGIEMRIRWGGKRYGLVFHVLYPVQAIDEPINPERIAAFWIPPKAIVNDDLDHVARTLEHVLIKSKPKRKRSGVVG